MTKFDKGYIEKALGIPVFAHGTLDSTSSEARRLLRDGRCAPFLVVADSQSEGRGRQGKSFLSPKGGLYMSIALPAPEKNAVSITTRACVALARAIRSLTGEDVKIKWVNDIWLGDRKVAGILTEAVGDENGNVYSVIIGIGVNLFGVEIPDSLREIATTLQKKCSRDLLTAKISEEIISLTENTADTSYVEEYKSLSLVLNREITYTQNGTTHTGVARKINSDGSLTVVSGGGEVTLSSGEITVRLK